MGRLWALKVPLGYYSVMGKHVMDKQAKEYEKP
jgi:hypothetical protein